MHRIDKVARELKKISKGISKTELIEGSFLGFTANHLSERLQIARNSVSEDLNELVKKGRAIKIKSRPVYFFDLQILEYRSGKKIDIPSDQHSQIKDYFALSENQSGPIKFTQGDDSDQIFNEIIGSNESMEKIIAKLKAAMLYPPFGLNVLLTGEAGVGKNKVAETVHKYMENYQQQSIPFIYFNCSEYHSNPELLTSHLFGHVKGAFTGADFDKTGLIEKANNGFLFLDEVHRLTSEGQEKLFTVLDRRSYSRMGESHYHPVNVRIICATTEDTQSALLQTFLRRIQVVAQIPSLNERTEKERLELALFFFQQESNQIKKSLKVSENILKSIANQNYPGNVGQMRSDIQLLCAEGYLQSMTQNLNAITIDYNLIEDKKLLSILADPAKQSEDVFFIPGDPSISAESLLQLPKSIKQLDPFYSLLLKEYKELQNNNLSHQDILAFLREKIQSYFDYTFEQKNVSKIIPDNKQANHKIESIVFYLETTMQLSLTKQKKNILINHIYSLILLIKNNSADHLFLFDKGLVINKLDYFEEVKNICTQVEDTFQITCPLVELSFMSLFLQRLLHEDDIDKKNCNCDVVIIAHGESTASSLAGYTNKLFQKNTIQAIDIPFEQPVNETLNLLKLLVDKQNIKKLVLLVDVGSPMYFGNIISKEFQIDVLMIKDINLLSIIELMNVIMYESTDFNYLLSAMHKRDLKVVLYQKELSYDRQVIIITCATGIGAAIKIKNLLKDTFGDYLPSNLRLLTLSYEETKSIDKLSSYLEEHEYPLAMIGTFKTELIDVPFIPLDILFSEKGIENLMIVLGYNMNSKSSKTIKEEISSNYIQNVSLEAIVNYIHVLNPQKLLIEMKSVYEHICRQLDINPSILIMLRFLIHCCCTVERLVSDNHIDYKTNNFEMTPFENQKELSVIQLSLRPIELSYDIKFPSIEIKYIYEVLFY
ncbi:sigma 54-interacting transcriptional regulator [Oceanobacillus jeddahense]|uniref:Sigma 54-interacting transcriptional regulator n=1 Tax=Oceanobacillus jeddahense TaxID=1462527 RepID=A0ABY5JWF8_9BACI|nr:sigma-54-dependent transcriptional regulator [Oceanobacillus jeddahense]UUI02904.1 sigma 54-interacting transcriptional regulator [Oceanobacillus jeddahense]